MDTQLKTPTQPEKISKADTKRIAAFTRLITDGICPDNLHKTLVQMYIEYTSLLVKYPDQILADDTSLQLYFLSLLIKVTE